MLFSQSIHRIVFNPLGFRKSKRDPEITSKTKSNKQNQNIPRRSRSWASKNHVKGQRFRDLNIIADICHAEEKKSALIG